MYLTQFICFLNKKNNLSIIFILLILALHDRTAISCDKKGEIIL